MCVALHNFFLTVWCYRDRYKLKTRTSLNTISIKCLINVINIIQKASILSAFSGQTKQALPDIKDLIEN